MEAGATGADLDILLGLARLDFDPLVGQRACDFGQQAARQQDRALALDLGLEVRPQAEVEVGGGKREPLLAGR